MSNEKLPVPVGYVYRLRVEPDWGTRGLRTEYEFFFPKKLGRTETKNFLASERLSEMHHSWDKIHYGSRNLVITNH